MVLELDACLLVDFFLFSQYCAICCCSNGYFAVVYAKELLDSHIPELTDPPLLTSLPSLLSERVWQFFVMTMMIMGENVWLLSSCAQTTVSTIGGAFSSSQILLITVRLLLRGERLAGSTLMLIYECLCLMLLFLYYCKYVLGKTIINLYIACIFDYLLI